MAIVPAADWRGEMRRVLRERNYAFCDDEAPQLPAAQFEARPGEEAELLHLGLDSSSCDREGQDIDNTLDDEYTFWSSAGTSPDADEHLTYCFKFPLCRLTRVDIKVFRATFQFGDPIYPAQQVSFKIGSSRQNLWQVPGCFQMAASDDWQSYPMPATAPVGQLLMVCLHRKCQMQWGDRRFYVALQQR
ncbi:hypothetical protein WJX73_009690 [Symbiochloris irregularis]|uniref:Anaphase-promoting complex subunit 10 n=1 Tax=Symbiochloris irregularis TaxID=706552 RepID=A0AAW1PHL2_9CHLO